MASHVLYDAVILYDALVLSSYLNQVNFNYGARQLDDSSFGDDTEINKASVLAASASVVGKWDPGTTGDPDSTLFSDVGSDDKLFSAFPEAAAAGARGFSLQTSRALYTPTGNWGELFMFNAEGNGRSRLVRATVLDNSTETSTGNGTAQQEGAVQGWNDIVAGTNDKLDFTEGTTGDATATITAGKYATGAALATEIQTQMNSAATDNTYTCTYSTSTHKFTIARDTGSDTIGLEWSTGSNAATTIGDDIGFDTSADDTGATSYTSDFVSRPTPQKLYAFLHVTATSGEGDQTLDVVIKSDSASDHSVSPATRVTFTQVTTSVGAQFATPVSGAISDDYWRAEWTIGGTGSPSFTFLVGMGIMYNLGADLT